MNGIEDVEIQEWIRQGQVLTGQELFSDAEGYFNKALESDPVNYTAYMSRGIMWASCGELSKAKLDFSKAVKINREQPDAYYHLGNIAFLEDAFEEGVKYFNLAISKGYDDAELYFHFGMVYEENQKYEDAIRHYTKAIHKEGLNPEYRIRKTIAQTKLELWEEALETLDGLFLIAPDSFDYYHLKALVLISMHKIKEANALLAEANERFPDDLDLLNDRISVLVSMGNTKEALAYISKAKDGISDPISLQQLLLSEGKLYAAEEQMERAIIALNKVVDINAVPVHSTEALYLLINIYNSEGSYTQMINAAEKMSAFENVNAYALSAWYYIALGKKERGDEDSETYYREIVKKYRQVALDDPSRIDAYLYRAMAYKDIKEYQKAMEMVDYIALLQPDNADLHIIKAVIYSEMGQQEKAESEKNLAKKGSSLLRLE